MSKIAFESSKTVAVSKRYKNNQLFTKETTGYFYKLRRSEYLMYSRA
ncbi:hypothetical protein RUMCAL_00460, partial [Ruminococcus callidus ATCC 27760]